MLLRQCERGLPYSLGRPGATNRCVHRRNPHVPLILAGSDPQFPSIFFMIQALVGVVHRHQGIGEGVSHKVFDELEGEGRMRGPVGQTWSIFHSYSIVIPRISWLMMVGSWLNQNEQKLWSVSWVQGSKPKPQLVYLWFSVPWNRGL